MKIDSNIPLPPKKTGCKPGIYAVTASQMQVGDSVLCDARRANSLAIALRMAYGVGSGTTRKDQGKVRVWRVK